MYDPLLFDSKLQYQRQETMKISDVREKGPGLYTVMSLSYSEFQDGASDAHMPL